MSGISMRQRRGWNQHLLIGAVLALAAAGAIVLALDWQAAQRIIGRANWELVPMALLFTAISYICLSYGFAAVARIFGIRMGLRDLFEIGFVSIVLNHLISSAGTAGYSLRTVLMKRRGIPIADILALSIFHSYLNNLALFALLPVGLFHILLYESLSTAQAIGIGIATSALLLVFSLATMVFFYRPARLFLLGTLRGGASLILRRNLGPALSCFNSALEEGVSRVRQRLMLLALPVGLIVADWAASIAALWFCFEAIGSPIGLGVLVTGFSIGVTAGLLSLVPGGLGIQEGSMAGIYALSGVPLEQAVLASILFRVVYYFIPFAVSLPFYWRLLGKVKKDASKANGPSQ